MPNLAAILIPSFFQLGANHCTEDRPI
jgi:hypothetical protein